MLTDLVHPDDVPAVRSEWSLLGRQASLQITFRQRAARGAWHSVEAQADRIVHSGTEQVMMIARDLTERLDQTALQQQLAALLTSSEDAIIGKRLDETIFSWNAGAERIYGYRADEMIGRSVALLVPDDLPDELPTILERLQRGERIRHYETTRLRKDGTRIDVIVTISPIKNAAGTIIGAATIARDITEQKRIAAELQRKQAELTDSIEQVPVAIHWLDAEGQILWANQAELDLLGYTADEYIGHHIAEFHVDQAAINDILRRLHQGELVEDQRACLRGKDGALRHVLINANVLCENGTFVRAQTFTRNITKRIEAEDDRQRLTTLVEQQREYFKTILASVPGVVWEAWGQPDASSQRINFVSDYVETMLGYSVEEWLQTPNFWLTIVHPDDREYAAGRATSAFTSGKGSTSQFRWITRDGRTLWVEAQSMIIYDETGKPAGMRGVTIDITERKHTEQALREQREWLAVTLGSIGDAVIATDAAGRIMLMNPMAEALTGWQQTQVLGQASDKVFRVIDAATRQSAADPVALVVRQGTAFELTHHHLVVHDGTERPIDYSAAPIRGADESMIGVVLVFRDVTERERASTQQRILMEAGSVLATSLDYETTLQSVANLVVSTLADWCLVDILDEDDALQRLVVAHHDSEKVALAREVQQHYPIDPAGARGSMKVICSGESMLVSEISEQLLVAAGYEAYFTQLLRDLGLRSYMCVPLIARDRVLGTLTFITDVPGRHYDQDDLRLAEELGRRAALAVDNARLYREAQAALRARDDFLSIAAHELKTPLTSLLGFTQALLRRATGQQPYTLTPRDQQGLQVVASQTRRLHGLIEDLMNVGRLRAGRLGAQRQVMDIGDFVRRIVAEQAPILEQHTLECSCATPPLFVEGDQQGLEEVLQNLLQNAVKYSPHGGHIHVEITAENEEVAISITDQGIGIPPQVLSHLFQPFYRAPSSAQWGIKGTGIGLYVVKEIVGQHGGSVEVQSEVGSGSTFTIRLPLYQIPLQQSVAQ
jgi:PAS domain S-box-containing protein